MEQARVDFTVDPAVIYDLVYSQSGPLNRAFMELIMNGVDALGDRVAPIVIQIDGTTFSIADEGVGFKSLDEVYLRFGTFGVRHEANDKTHGRFSLGRAQMMVHAAMNWQSNNFTMGVDIKHYGFSYQVGQTTDAILGCRIEGAFYEPMSPLEVQRLITELETSCRYCRTPILVNNRQITMAKPKWDYEDDLCAVMWKDRGKLDWYDRGFFVRGESLLLVADGDEYVQAVVMVKQRMEVNIARDQILNHCPTAKAVRATLRNLLHGPRPRRDPFGEHEKREAVRRWLGGTTSTNAVIDMPLITDVTGIHHRVGKLLRSDSRILSIAPRNSADGVLLHKRREAFVLSDVMLDRFGASSIENLHDIIAEALHADGHSLDVWNSHVPTPLARLTHLITADDRLFEPSEVPLEAQYAMRAIYKCLPQFNYTLSTGGLNNLPGITTLRMSASDASTVTIHRSRRELILSRAVLNNMHSGLGGWVEITVRVADSMLRNAHDATNLTEAQHSRRLYDLVRRTDSRTIYNLALNIMSAYIDLLQANGAKIKARTMKVLDHQTQLATEYARIGLVLDIRPESGVE